MEVSTSVTQLHFSEGEEELRAQISRIGVPGEWTRVSDTFLRFDTHPSVAHASLQYHKESMNITFEGDITFREKFARASLGYNDPMANLEVDNLPDRIMENLYLGSHHAALNFEGLKERNITHIITAARSLTMAFQNEIKYKYIDLLDWEEEDIYQHFESCLEFIEEGRKNGAVLIHCAAGVSRSATITIAYIMKLCGYSYSDARTFVQARRWIYPNTGFVRHLIRWEKTLEERRKALKKAKKQAKMSNLNDNNPINV